MTRSGSEADRALLIMWGQYEALCGQWENKPMPIANPYD